jgi:hypothetical protein
VISLGRADFIAAQQRPEAYGGVFSGFPAVVNYASRLNRT